MSERHVPVYPLLTRQEVLAFIAKHPEGLRFTDIQRFIVEWHGLDYDKIDSGIGWDGKKFKRRRYRGWWCDNLLGKGNSPYRSRWGILNQYCVRNTQTKRYSLRLDVNPNALKANTVKAIVTHEQTAQPGFTFFEDESHC